MTGVLSEPHTVTRRRENLVLAAVSVCTVLVVGFVAAINLAVPMLAASALHPDSSQLLWIVDAYVVVFACLVIPGGAFGDRFGRKGTLLTGLVVFALGAVVSALSTGLPVMLSGRVLSGLGAALVLPNCVGVLVHATRPERRRGALALWGAISGIGGVLGNTGGAALLSTGRWQTLFWGVVPFALVCVAAIAALAGTSPRTFRRLDPAGTLLLVATSVVLLVGIIEAPEVGWDSALVLGAFVLAGVLAVVWVLVELRVEHPVLDPRLFRGRLLAGASLGMLVTWFGSFGLFYLNASLLQYGRGFPVLLAGLATLPLAGPILLGTRFLPRLVTRVGVPLILGGGFLAICTGLVGLSFATRQSFGFYAFWLVVVGIGFALALPTLTSELTAGLPPEQAGVAGGLQSATRELGSALGIAVVGTIAVVSFSAHLPLALQSLDPLPRTVASALSAAPWEHNGIIDAFVTGGSTALRIGAGITLVTGAIVVALISRPGNLARRASSSAS
ncbi:MFS transporter [Lentzea sp. NPDC058436]|uniref:MFS transporter n=1 Tax=Lentzea sp. NPDC058436 TaxID=3346499 RepID=UPI00364FBCCB